MKRYLEKYILKDLKKKIVLLSGPRQTGKTTLSKMLMTGYDYFNYDSSEDRIGLIEKSWDRSKDLIIFDETIKAIVNDLQHRISVSKISAKFHNTLACAVVDVCKRLRKENKIKRIALSGGVFQNKYLDEKVRELLRSEKFEVFVHKNFKPNDSSIPIGQAAIAARR